MEENLNEVDGENDSNELLKSATVILTSQEVKVVEDNVLNLVLVEAEHLLQNLSDLVQLEHLILVQIVTEENHS